MLSFQPFVIEWFTYRLRLLWLQFASTSVHRSEFEFYILLDLVLNRTENSCVLPIHEYSACTLAYVEAEVAEIELINIWKIVYFKTKINMQHEPL